MLYLYQCTKCKKTYEPDDGCSQKVKCCNDGEVKPIEADSTLFFATVIAFSILLSYF